MNSKQIFKMALGIELPWEVARVKFEEVKEDKA